MEKIIYRSIQSSDYKAIKKMMDDAWNSKQYTQNKSIQKHMLKAYLRMKLFKQNYIQIAEYKGEVVGALIGKIYPKPKSINRFKHVLPMLYHGLHLRLKASELLKGQKQSDLEYERLEKSSDLQYDANLSMFNVDHAYQGKKIGKTLLQHFHKACKEANVKTMHVYTDTESNHGFYEHVGFVFRGEGQVTFKLKTLEDLSYKIFMLDYTL